MLICVLMFTELLSYTYIDIYVITAYLGSRAYWGACNQSIPNMITPQRCVCYPPMKGGRLLRDRDFQKSRTAVTTYHILNNMKCGGNCPGPPCARRAKGGDQGKKKYRTPQKPRNPSKHTYICTYKLHLMGMYIVCSHYLQQINIFTPQLLSTYEINNSLNFFF